MDKVKDAETTKKTSDKKSAGVSVVTKKQRGNPQNLIPNDKRSPSEVRKNAKKGGIKSGQVRREKRDRREQARMILELAVKDPKMIEKLDELGIGSDNYTIETAMDASMARKAIDVGDVQAYKALKEEAWGKMESHDKLDINAEVKSINITLRNYGGEE